MYRELLDLLDDKNVFLQESDVTTEKTGETPIEQGVFSYKDKTIQICNGVPVFFSEEEENMDEAKEEQKKTNDTFSAKWNVYMREQNEATYSYMMDFVQKRLVPLGIHNEDEF